MYSDIFLLILLPFISPVSLVFYPFSFSSSLSFLSSSHRFVSFYSHLFPSYLLFFFSLFSLTFSSFFSFSLISLCTVLLSSFSHSVCFPYFFLLFFLLVISFCFFNFFLFLLILQILIFSFRFFFLSFLFISPVCPDSVTSTNTRLTLL